MNYVGTISKVTERKWGSTLLTSWQLKGQNVWYRTEGDSALLTEGTAVAFEGPTPNKIDFDSIGEVTEDALMVTTEIVSGQRQPPMMRDDYWRWKQLHDLEKEDSYDYGRARHDAVLVLTCALNNDMLDIPKNLSKAKRYGMLMAVLNEVTNDLVIEAKEYKSSE